MAEPSARPTSDGDLTSRELNTRPRDRVVGHERELRDSVVVRQTSGSTLQTTDYSLYKSILPMLVTRLVFCPPENKKNNSLIRQWLMLRQMNTYLKAIARNGHLFKGKVCLDVGCGLGVRVSSNLNLFPPTSSYLI